MHAIGKKVLELFESWAWRTVDEIKAAMAETSDDEAIKLRIKEELTKEYRKLSKTVSTVNPKTEHTVQMMAGLVELQRFRTHPAFNRIEACATCVKRSRRALKWCSCPSPMQLFIDKAFATFSQNGDKRMLMLTLLQLREAVEHFYFYGSGKPAPKLKLEDPREREALRESIKITKEDWKNDKVLRSTEVFEMAGTDSTSRLYLDLQGWDRPSAPAKKTTRMAFCGHCAENGGQAWFQVARRRINGEYERAPFALTAKCPVCSNLETKPADKAPRTDIQFVARTARRKGKVTTQYFTFYRSRGWWVRLDTQEVASTELNRKLQLRWLPVKPGANTDPAQPEYRYDAEAERVCLRATTIEDFTNQTGANLRRLLKKLDDAMGMLSEVPVGTLAARKRILHALKLEAAKPLQKLVVVRQPKK